MNHHKVRVQRGGPRSWNTARGWIPCRLICFSAGAVPADPSKPIGWGTLLLFLGATTLFNGPFIAFLKIFVVGVDAGYMDFASAMMMGDILGSLAIMVGYFMAKHIVQLGQKFGRNFRWHL